MKNYKRLFWGSVLVTIVWFSSFGCVTKAVWEDKHTSSQYNETILAFYTNEKNNTIVFIGDKCHYIFNDGTEEFIELLKDKDLLNLQQENLRIRASVSASDTTVINTYITATFDINKLNREQKLWFGSHKYRNFVIPPHPNREREVKVFVKDYNIRGNRYLANQKVNLSAVKLKRAIPLKITEYKIDKGNIAKKIALTPLSVTADAVGSAIVLAGVVVLLPVGLIASIFD